MKNNYCSSFILGIMCLTFSLSQSQNILFDGEFSETTEIIPFEIGTPPLNQWAFWLNSVNGAEAYPTVIEEVCNFQIFNPGYNTWDVQLAQWGFPLNQGHLYQLSFKVRADEYRSFGVFLGEEGGSYTNLIGFDNYFYDATTEWQPISIEFEATSVFDLHKLSFELGTNGSTMYFDDVMLQDLGPAPPKKIVIAGTFQDELGCYSDWDPNCDYTELSLNSSTGLYTGTFQVAEGNNRYKVTVGGSWDINYGENGLISGPDIFLCLPSGPEEITFTYDPSTNLVTTSPIASGFSPDCLPLVVLAGSFQDELGCYGDWLADCTNTALTYNSGSGLFEGDLNIPSGCYEYRVVLENTWINNFGQEGIHNGLNYILYIPANPDITHFTYDPFSHIVNSTPYSDPLEEVTKVSLLGSLQDELGCASDYDYGCDNPALLFNPDSGAWEGSFTLPAGCYTYRVKETIGCFNIMLYGENGIEWGDEIQLYIPSDSEITFSYDPQTHILTSTPYSGAPQEVTKVSLVGTLQDEFGCAYDYDYECDNPALLFNSDTNLWEGSFTLPAGCYSYRVKETFGCYNVFYYGENGIEWGDEIQLYIPSDSEITFSYDPQTHIISSTPYSGAPQEVTKVSLMGSLQDELGCTYDYDYGCENPMLVFNSDTNLWEGSFTLPAGCYTYRVKETVGCNNIFFYGENGTEWGNELQLYIPSDSEITFSYNAQTHIMSSTPYSGAPQEVTKVSLMGNLQDELGCDYDYNTECDNSALVFNPDLNVWEGSFTLPAGCYAYRVQETVGCNSFFFYGENGVEWGNEIQLYVPSDGEITFSYDPQTHIMTSTPYSGTPQEVTKVSLMGNLQDELGCDYDYDYECNNPALVFNSDLNVWEGSFTLPAGCYSYLVKESFACNIVYYGENGIEWGNMIQLYVPTDGEITFSYDPQTHIMSSTPYNSADLAVTKVSLIGTLQDELGCAYDYDYGCDSPALTKNEISGLWEGSFMLPAGCYKYSVQQTDVCDNITYYSYNGDSGMGGIQLVVPSDALITFTYDPITHIINSSPFDSAQLGITNISLYGTLQNELGCAYDYDYECNNPALAFNSDSNLWEGSFTFPAGCYSYWVKETVGCDDTNFYGQNGEIYGNFIELYVPLDSEITFSYDPQTHIITSTPYSGAPQEVTNVSLMGSLQDELGCTYDYNFECDNPALVFNSDLSVWQGSYTLPAGCYTYMVKETFGCNSITLYGENGLAWGYEIQLYIPSDSEITFSYDPQTHIISSTPYFDITTSNQCPDNISVDNSPGSCGAIVNYPEFVVTANCGGDILSITQTEGLPSGSYFPVGITTNSFVLYKTTGEEITCSFDVNVMDIESPVISDLNLIYEPVWPPNHKMVPVFIDYIASDNCNIASTELFISSNEPENGHGDGNNAPDWEILDEHNVLLRAERSGKGDGREYYITIKVIDDSGNFTEQIVTIVVSHDNVKITKGSNKTTLGKNEFILYPNAVEHVVNIKGPKSSSDHSYEIYDILGAIKKKGTIINDQIDVETLSSGLYILKFEMDNDYIFKKFVKK